MNMRQLTRMARLNFKKRSRSIALLGALLLAAGCAGSDYYAVDRQQDNTDYVNRISCPGDTLPVCIERGGEIVRCECVRDTDLGKVIY